MGPWTYYSPLWLGALLVLAINDMIRAAYLHPDWLEWLIVAGWAVVSGVALQVLFVGAQGVFAQVIPVPLGKSIRGGAGAGIGWALIAGILLLAVAGLLFREGVSRAAWVLLAVSVISFGTAIVLYVWNVPAAVRDFGDGRRRGARAEG